MSKGILKVCSLCQKVYNCCCGFDLIDFPILSINEYSVLRNKYKAKETDFVKLNGGFYKYSCKKWDMSIL